MNLSKLQEIVDGRGTWCAIVHGVTKSQTQISDWTTTTNIYIYIDTHIYHIHIKHVYIHIDMHIYSCIHACDALCVYIQYVYIYVYVYIYIYIYIYIQCAVAVQYLSHVWLFVAPWTVTHQAPLYMEFSKQEYWSGFSFLSPGDLPDPGIELRSPALQADSLPLSHQGSPYIQYIYIYVCVCVYSVCHSKQKILY